MAKFLPSEIVAINRAYFQIKRLCTRTNWTDSGEWREAEKLERKQASSGCDMPVYAARAICAKAWAEGLDNPGIPARKIYWIRPGYRDALLLGVRHAIERRGDDYNGPLVEECRTLCDAAIAANEAHTRRIMGRLGRE